MNNKIWPDRAQQPTLWEQINERTQALTELTLKVTEEENTELEEHFIKVFDAREFLIGIARHRVYEDFH